MRRAKKGASLKRAQASSTFATTMMQARSTLAFLLVASACSAAPSPGQRAAAAPAAQLAAPQAAALDRLRRRPPWLFPAEGCPADVAPAAEQETTYTSEVCVPDLGQCLDRCQENEANGCYAAALRLQELDFDEEYSEALFFRACRLGSRTGCTNRAAGMMNAEPEREAVLRCATRTFQLMCESDDAWGCTMFGSSLMRGAGVRQDLELARKVLPKGCRHGSEDPACVNAQQLLRSLEGMSQGGSPQAGE
jgi:TPR repeat protein